MINVLIVEDEAILRKGIVSLINWQALGCEVVGDVANGLQALDLIAQTKIDLVITDIKMPGMNGLELAKKLHELYPEIGIIILSAYSDFDYARQAIRYNTLNYVLKSDFVHELPVAVESAVFVLGQRDNSAQKTLGVDDKRLAHILFEKLLGGDLGDMTVLTRLFHRLNLNCGEYYLVLVELDHQEYSEFRGGSSPPAKAAENFLDMAFQEYPHFCSRLSDSLFAVLIGIAAPGEESQYRLALKCNEILATASNYMEFDANMGLSGRFGSFGDIPAAFSQAKTALGGAEKKAPSLSVCGESQGTDAVGETPDIKPVAEQLLRMVAAGEDAESQSIVDKLFEAYGRSRATPESIRMQLLLLFSYIHLNHPSFGIQIPEMDRIILESYDRVRSVISVYALKKAAKAFVEQLLRVRRPIEQESNSLVDQVNRYIADRYAGSIKLDTLADHLHVSSSYLSRLYKKKTGISIITYLNSYRVERAKELFAQGEYTVADVGYRVGFENPAYFTHVFTKYAGQNPKSFCRELPV